MNAWGKNLRLSAGCMALLWTASRAFAAPAPLSMCVGDCDGSGHVSVDELIRAVNVGLGDAELSSCPAYTLDCGVLGVCITGLLTAVNNALYGCPTIATTAGIVFNGEDNRLHAYQPGPGFPMQVVIPSNADSPGGVGRDLNGQICFTHGPEGQLRLIGGEDTNQGHSHDTAGWGLFEIAGTQVGDFQYQEIGKLTPTYQPTPDGAENYGCGFLSDGRLLTTDVGNQAGGMGNGQLIIWFPPLDTGATYTDTGVVPNARVHYCKLDVTIGTAQQIAVDAQDRVYVGSSRSNGLGGQPGIYRYTGPFPTSDTPDGGCDGTDGTGAPMATHVNKELFIPNDTNIPTPAGVVIKPDGGFYVSSVLNGVIAEYGADGTYKRSVLTPSNSGFPIQSGTPLGIGLASDGTIYYADIGLRVTPSIGPGDHTGSVRRLRFVNGAPQPPEIMNSGLDFPDGIGVLELAPPAAAAAE